jgi:hypothetical protein
MATPYNPEWDDEFCARCLQLDDGCKCYEIDEEEDEQDSDLCPVCQDLPIPEFQGCSCWLCSCMTTNPAARTLCSCGKPRPSDVESVTRRLVALANNMERIPATAEWGSVATLREAADLLRTHAFPSDHLLMLD